MVVAPTIGIRHAFIDRVVVLADQGGETAIVDVALLWRERTAFA